MIALVGAMFVAMGTVRAAPGISVEFSDTDGVIADGGDPVLVYVRDASTGSSSVDNFAVTAVTVSGELAGTELPGVPVLNTGTILGGTQLQGRNVDDSAAATNHVLSITVPKGTPAGEYVVTATATNTSTTPSTVISDDAILTVGNPGTAVDSVEISFNKFHMDAGEDTNSGTADDVKTCGAAPAPEDANDADATDTKVKKTESTDDANAPDDDPICLVATVKNSLGKTTNDDDVKLLFITAEGATIRGEGLATDGASSVATVPEEDRGAKYTFSVENGSSGMVLVEVDAGPAEGSIELTFTGGAMSLSIADASDVLARSGDAYDPTGDDNGTPSNAADDKPTEGGIIFEVTASDKAGNSVDLATGDVTAVKITDSDGKDVTSSFNTDNEMQKAGSSQVVQVRVGTKSTKVAAGEYTAEVSLTEVNDSKVSAMFSVADVPDDVSLSASAMTSEMIGDVITVTATVTDASGNPVADGTDVDFDVSSSTGLAGIGKGHGANDTVDTVGGMASVKYAVVGHGTSVVSATAGGATGVVVIESTAGMVEPEAMPVEEASVGCLSNLSGFSTWSCGVESSASEIFGLVSARGVTAIHLHNGTAWVRYSVVDGAMVPGSSDFMVTENDILYISN